jgi:hypothetical protein
MTSLWRLLASAWLGGAAPAAFRDSESRDVANQFVPAMPARHELRREVAMAYRTACEAGRSHHEALDAASAVYSHAHSETLGDPLAASARVDEMIASTIRVDPQWFWKNVHALIELGHPII